MKFLSFGSMNIDYVYHLDEIVKEGQTVPAVSREKNAGGKGLNQAIALSKAGGQVYFAGCAGDDGGFLKEVLEDAGVDVSLTGTSQDQTGHAIIQVDRRGKNCIIVYGGANLTVTEEYADSVIEKMSPGDCIALQNEINCLDYIIDRAYRKGLVVLMNPSPIGKDIFSYPLEKVSILNVNEYEGAYLAFPESTEEKTPDQIIAKLSRTYPQTKILLTLGNKGAVFFDGKTIFRQNIFDLPVLDTTAAGDTFTGYFMSCYGSGRPVQECLRTASAASALCVSRKGASVSIPGITEVDNFLNSQKN